jgi:hypothetical protein
MLYLSRILQLMTHNTVSNNTLAYKAKVSCVILEKLSHELQNTKLGKAWTILHLTPETEHLWENDKPLRVTLPLYGGCVGM